MELRKFLAWLVATCAPIAAQAQTATAPQESKLASDHLTIGVGAIYGPSYEGSDDYVATPVPMVQGKLAGVEITPRPGGAALDLVPDARDARIGFSLGPVATWSGERRRQVKDPVVRASGKLKPRLETGLNGGVTLYRLLHNYDSVTMSADIKWDINGAHRGRVISPQLTYFTPLSKAAFVSIGASAKRVDGDYARYYFSIGPAQSLASGLPQFAARGGWISAGANVVAGHDLDGDYRNGGFSIIALGGYSRLMNSARRSPVTTIRGDPDQWMGGLGLGFTF